MTCIEVCDVVRREREVPTMSGAYSGILIIRCHRKERSSLWQNGIHVYIPHLKHSTCSSRAFKDNDIM